MALAITQALTISAASKDENSKVIANFYANVSPQGASNNLQMTVVDRELFVQNMDLVKADLQTFIADFVSKYAS